MERNSRRILSGVVVSDKMDKTITVKVETTQKHSLYSKQTKNSKKYKAHDANNEACIGDKVTIVETRPLSKDKRFRLLSVTEKAAI